MDLGQLTTYDKHSLLTQIKERIQCIEEEIQLQSEGTRAHRECLTQQEKIQKKEDKIQIIIPIPIHELRYQPNIQLLRKELQPFLQWEENNKGRLLTVKELTHLARKDEILEEIEEWEQKSREWFEEEKVFQDRVQRSRAKNMTKEKGAKKNPLAVGMHKGEGNHEHGKHPRIGP